MQNRLVAAILVATILGSCLIGFSDDGYDARLDSNQRYEYSESVSAGEFKIHRPGEAHDAEETLVWYPNNITELSTMQFTIMLDNSFSTETITQIEIVGNIEITEQQEIEQFSTTIVDFDIEEIDGRLAIIENYNYPSTVWGGNYSITVEFSFSSSNNLILERDDIQFSSYGLFYGTQSISQDITLCLCEVKQIELSLTNTGEDEFGFSYEIELDESYPNALIEMDEETEDTATGTIMPTEIITFRFTIQIAETAVVKDGMIDIPIYLRAFYENDDGFMVYLFDDDVGLKAIVLEDAEYPAVELSFGEFDYSLEYLDGNQPKIPQNLNPDLFSFDADFFQFEMNISNNGYYDRELRLEPTNPTFNYRVIIGNDNLSIGEFNFRKPVISSLDSIVGTIMIENIDAYEFERIGFNAMFNDSLNSMIYFDMRAEPVVSTNVLTHSPATQEITELPAIITELVDVNLIDYEDHLFFDNEWVLLCSATGLAMVEIPIFDSTCNDSPVEIIYAEDSSKLSSIAVEIKLDESYTDESVSVELALLPAALPVTAEAIHELTIQIPINLPNNNNDNQTNNSNNTNNTDNSNNSNNNTNDNNSNNEDNQTDYDLDDDGIPDLVDNCPDTAQGAAVDSYGCTIDEQNNDNTQQDNTGQQQDSENTASKAEESNVLLYSIIGFILATVVIGVFIVKNRSSAKTKNSAIAVAAEPIMPLPVMPLPALEPVVLQQWTDANGYSWRQMSDQTIMWWNGTDWIPYGKN